MTIDQFKAQAWTPNMRGEYLGVVYTITAVDFGGMLIGLRNPLDDNEVAWVRCENVNLSNVEMRHANSKAPERTSGERCSLPVLSGLFEWVAQRMRLAERSEIAAARRNDHARALRFEHEHNALLPVLEKLAAEMGAAKKRRPAKNVRDEPRGE